MPLVQSGTCGAFWGNYKELYASLKSKHPEDTANRMAIAAAAKVCREHGGNPETCLDKKSE